MLLRPPCTWGDSPGSPGPREACAGAPPHAGFGHQRGGRRPPCCFRRRPPLAGKCWPSSPESWACPAVDLPTPQCPSGPQDPPWTTALDHSLGSEGSRSPECESWATPSTPGPGQVRRPLGASISPLQVRATWRAEWNHPGNGARRHFFFSFFQGDHKCISLEVNLAGDIEVTSGSTRWLLKSTSWCSRGAGRTVLLGVHRGRPGPCSASAAGA